ncbi:MAG: alpha/beta hydrolase, partial [candidate division Zixibacteria bacterium]|nr:alpha/beta hydrolase [candidate division Zixibacteria bacterium]
GNISHRIESVKIFHDLDLNVFIFDYRGYGKSGGKISENGTYLDSEAAMNYLVNEKQTDPTNIVIFGRSLGGSIASWLAKEHTPCALILESSFTSVADAAGDVYPFLPVKLISRFDYNTQENVRIVKCPILIVHSRQDELIKFKHGQKLFETSGEPKMFLELTGSHNDGFILSGKRYVNGLKTFLNQYLNKE